MPLMTLCLPDNEGTKKQVDEIEAFLLQKYPGQKWEIHVRGVWAEDGDYEDEEHRYSPATLEAMRR